VAIRIDQKSPPPGDFFITMYTSIVRFEIVVSFI